jgi:glycosyltransferase involved in cell wall biosynthesis
MLKQTRKIVIISPVRNEEKFISGTIAAIVNQSLRPVEWIIVDDGSTDQTASIIKQAAKKYNWIKYVQKPDRGERAVGPGVVETFDYGYQRLQTSDWNYICKLDGDLELDKVYFETLVEYFERDQFLGSASGKVFIEHSPDTLVEERTADEMVAGCANFYRRHCFEDIGGFVKWVMWDGIAYHRARMNNWRTRSIRDKRLDIIHKRIMGSSHKSLLHGRLRWGRGQYFMGTHPLYILAIGLYRTFEKPFILGGISIILGYVSAWIKNIERYDDWAFRKSLHAWQMERLKIGSRLEKIPEIESGLYPANVSN